MKVCPPTRASIGTAQSPPVRIVALLAAGAMLGKVLGFLREVMMARTFGATVAADSFRGSISAVLLPLGPLLNESTPSILIPMCRTWISESRGSRELAEMTIALGLTAFLIMLLIQLCGPWWVGLIVGGFSAEGQRLALEFIRIMALMMPAAVVLNCLAAADIAHGQSRIAAVRASVINVFVTVGILAYILTGKLSFLPWSFAASFNATLLWGFWLLKREGKLTFEGLTLGGVSSAWREFMRRLRPLLAQPLVEQLHGWTERLVASSLLVGTMASLDYARTLTDTAALVIAQPIGMAVLYKGALPSETRVVASLSGGVLAVALPASLYLAVFAEDIVSLVFQRGAFEQTAVMLTSASLRGIAAGLWAATLGLVLLRLLNNAGRHGVVALLLAGAFLSNVGMSLLSGALAGSGGNGSLWLGLGEALRGGVLLAGVAIALKIVRPLVKMLLTSAGPLAILASLCMWIAADLQSLVLRLAAGGILTFATAGLLLMILAPDLVRQGWQRVKRMLAARRQKSAE